MAGKKARERKRPRAPQVRKNREEKRHEKGEEGGSEKRHLGNGRKCAVGKRDAQEMYREYKLTVAALGRNIAPR
jgi:hypothetical protein